MDAIVAAALKKWPNVPHCYGWLALDARGDWYMRDDRDPARRAVPQGEGQPDRAREAARVHRPQLRPTTNRRLVLPERAAARLRRARGGALRLAAAARHRRAAVDRQPRRRPARFRSAQVDEHGRLFLDTDAGYGIVHTLDMEAAADAVERGHWAPETVAFAELPARFGYRLAPEPPRSRRGGQRKSRHEAGWFEVRRAATWPGRPSRRRPS